MKKEKQRKVALSLVLCMVFSMFSGIPVKAEENGETSGLWFARWDTEWNGEKEVYFHNEEDLREVNVNDEEAWWGNPKRGNIYIEVAGAGVTQVTLQYMASLDGEIANEASKPISCIDEKQPGYFDFSSEFVKEGVYQISCNEHKANCNIALPYVGFYSGKDRTPENYLPNFRYARGEAVYVIPYDTEEISFSYSILADNNDYITLKDVATGEPISAGTEVTDTIVEVVINDNAAGDFGISVEGTAVWTNEDEHEETFGESIWCEDMFAGNAIIEDGEPHTGFAGCFITKESYEKDGNFTDESQASAQYWVHAATLQEVIDTLIEEAKDGRVEAPDGRTYFLENTGYIWTNVSYFLTEQEYIDNAKEVQYVTTPSGEDGIKGIIMLSNFEKYYVSNKKNPSGTYYQVQKWSKDNEEAEESELLYTCTEFEPDREDYGDTMFFIVDGNEKDGFTLDDDTQFSGNDLKAEGYELVATGTREDGFGMRCDWPEMHVDATTNVKMIGRFAEQNPKEANLYLGLYPDSDEIYSQVSNGVNHPNGTPDVSEAGYLFTDITTANIGDEILTIAETNCETCKEEGNPVAKVKVVPLSTTASVDSDFSDDVAIEEGTGEKALRDKLNIQDKIAGEEAVKKAIIDGKDLTVSLNMNTLEEDSTEAGIAEIAELIEKDAEVQYLDIGLNYQVEGVEDSSNSIEETNGDISVSMTIPETFAPSGKKWNPTVYRYHKGEAEPLEATYKNGKLSFATNKFSTYAIAVQEIAPIGIQIKTAPKKTSYAVGEKFDKTGMVVELVYADKTTETITDYTVPSVALTEDDTEIEIVYEKDGKKFTAKQKITVKAPATQEPTTQEPTTQDPATEAPKAGETKTVDGKKYTVTDVTDGKKSVTYVGSEKKEAKVVVPSTVTIDKTSYNVTAIGDNAFSGNTKLTTVTIPATVTKIGKNAFKGCTSLKKITIPKNVTEIDANAFYNCKKLTSVTFKGTKITKIGQGAFQKCVSLKSVTIPKSVKEIGKNAFNGCKKLAKVTFKGTAVKKIGKNAFKNIAKKVTIKVPKKKKAAYQNLLKKSGYKGTVK